MGFLNSFFIKKKTQPLEFLIPGSKIKEVNYFKKYLFISTKFKILQKTLLNFPFIFTLSPSPDYYY